MALELKPIIKAAFAGPAIPLSMLLLPLTVFVGPFFAIDMHLGFGTVGTLFLIVRSADAFLDVAVGQWSDRTRVVFGRRKTWILCAAPLLMAATYALCFPPSRISSTYFAAAIFTLYAAWTLVQIPHLSWGQDLGRDRSGRSNMSAWRESGTMIGTLVALLVPLLVAGNASQSQAAHAIHVIGAAVIVIIPLTILPAIAFVPDHASAEKPYRLRIRDTFNLFSNSTYRLAIGIVTTVYLALGIYNSVILILVDNDLAPRDFLWLVLFQYVVALLSVPAISFLAMRIGSRGMIHGFLAAFVTGLLIFFISPSNSPTTAAAGFLFIGVGVSAMFIVLPVIVSNIASESAASSGYDRLAEHLAIFNLSMKVSLAIGLGLGFLALQWLGYRPSAIIVGASSLSPPRLVGCLLPLAIFCFSGLLASYVRAWRKGISTDNRR